MSQSEKQERKYWECRRSIRIRLVGDGNDREEMERFFLEYLELDESFLRSMGDVRLERVPYGGKTKIKKEMIITFATVDARDVVRGAAVNLGSHGQEVGIRLEVPNHLRRSM